MARNEELYLILDLQVCDPCGTQSHLNPHYSGWAHDLLQNRRLARAPDETVPVLAPLRGSPDDMAYVLPHRCRHHCVEYLLYLRTKFDMPACIVPKIRASPVQEQGRPVEVYASLCVPQASILAAFAPLSNLEAAQLPYCLAHYVLHTQ